MDNHIYIYTADLLVLYLTIHNIYSQCNASINFDINIVFYSPNSTLALVVSFQLMR